MNYDTVYDMLVDDSIIDKILEIFLILFIFFLIVFLRNYQNKLKQGSSETYFVRTYLDKKTEIFVNKYNLYGLLEFLKYVFLSLFYIAVVAIVLFKGDAIGIKENIDLKNHYKNNDYKIVSGYVANLHLRDEYFDTADSFSVDDIFFYYYSDDYYGYTSIIRDNNNAVRSDDIPFKNGQQVRITYYHDKDLNRNIILKLETAKTNYKSD